MSRKIIQVSSKYKAKDGSEKWRNVNVGSAFIKDNGEISLSIDPGVSISCSEGVRITIKEPYDRDGGSSKYQPRAAAPTTKGNDQIPF